MLILVDMDNVIADLSGHARKVIAERYPEVELKEQESHFIGLDYPEMRERIAELYMEQGFFLSFQPVDGAIEGVRRLRALGHEVVICTSHIAKSDFCLTEKVQWLRKYLPEFTRRVVFAKDKTLVRGDFLIDDKPRVTGSQEPLWQHVLYDQPYNRHITGPRMSWNKVDEFLAFIDEPQAAK